MIRDDRKINNIGRNTTILIRLCYANKNNMF